MEYKLSIHLKANSNSNICWNGQSSYNGINSDTIHISNELIIISGKRSGRIDLHRVLYNTSSTIHLQVTKTLAFYYLCTGIPFTIVEMVLEVDQLSVERETDFFQPFTNQLEQYQIMGTNDLQNVFTATDNFFLTSLVYYIKGIQENDFNRLWQSFNSLYSIITPVDKEFDKLVGIRKFIEQHNAEFVRTLSHIDGDTVADIRKLRIREYILNNFDSLGQIDNFVNTVKRFSDVRLIQIFKDTLPYRIDHLKTCGKEVEINNHISACMSKNLRNNVELLCFYVLKYGYFIRNKYFHAEKADPYFVLKGTAETDEMRRMVDIFQHFLADLIRCNRLYL